MPRRPIAVSNPLFQVLLWIVTAICAACLSVICLLAFFGADPATEAQRSAMELCKYGFTTTLGALVGLLCGRAAGPDALVHEADATTQAAPKGKAKG